VKIIFFSANRSRTPSALRESFIDFQFKSCMSAGNSSLAIAGSYRRLKGKFATLTEFWRLRLQSAM
jgi:hypothetical protein